MPDQYTGTGDAAIVLYHSNCADGFAAAWAMSKALPNARFHAMQYGDDLPGLEEFERIYIVDFSLLRATLSALHQAKGIANVTLIDHHQTAFNELAGMPNCYIDLSHSGAILAWQHCFPDKKPPRLLEYVEDRDLWKFELFKSRAVNAYIASWAQDATFDRWDVLEHEISRAELFDNVVRSGEAIMRTQDIHVSAICSTAQSIIVDGHAVPAVHSPILQSEISEYLLTQYPEANFAVIHSDDGQNQRFSLRSRKDGHNVAHTCEHFGGGGHPTAAGFKMPSNQRNVILSPRSVACG